MDALRLEQVVAKASDLLQQTALSDKKFERCFEGVANLIGSNSIHLAELAPNGEQRYSVHESMQGMLKSYYAGGWHQQDIWTQRALGPSLNGSVVFDHMVIPKAEAERNPYIQEYCADWGVRYFSAFSWRSEGQLLGFTIIRAAGNPFSEEDELVLRRLRPVAIGAALTASVLRDARFKGIASGLEMSGRPSLILNQFGRVMFMTPGAEALQGHAFSVSAGEVRGLDFRSDAGFRKVTSWIVGRLPRPPNAFTVSSSTLKNPLVAFVVPVRSLTSADIPGAAVLLVFADPAKTLATEPEYLSALWGLTSREAQLANLFSRGLDLERAAEAMGLKLSSARQMQKSLLSKSGASRQAELAAMLSRLAIGSLPENI